MTAHPAVTVLMPAHNAAAYLAEALDSIHAQTFPDFELLVVDDASTDETPALLASFSDPRLRVLRNPRRLKLSGALNRGLVEARGALIARMDADDRMRPDRLARQVTFLERRPEIGCCSGGIRTFGTGPRVVRRFPSGSERVRAFSLFYAPFSHPAVMFRRDWLARHGLRYDGAYYPAEDYELWSRMLEFFPGDNLPEILLDYRVHARSMTGAEWPEMDRQTMRIHGRLIRRFGLEPSDEQVRLHRRASMGEVPGDADTLRRVDAWLTTIEAANRDRRRYEQNALRDMLHTVWFRTAMGCVRSAGRTAWQAYRAGRFARQGARARRHGWIVRGAARKAAILGAPR